MYSPRSCDKLLCRKMNDTGRLSRKIIHGARGVTRFACFFFFLIFQRTPTMDTKHSNGNVIFNIYPHVLIFFFYLDAREKRIYHHLSVTPNPKRIRKTNEYIFQK